MLTGGSGDIRNTCGQGELNLSSELHLTASVEDPPFPRLALSTLIVG